MPDQSSPRMCLAIGISNAPPLTFLRGALNGARDFHHWAQSDGYQSELLTDKDGPVTIDVLRGKLKAMLLSERNDISRFIIYFAGHGLIREAEEGLWLLSDWNNELRAVAVEALKRRLYKYGVKQISIFADACRSLPTNMDVAELVPDAVLGRGPVESTTAPYIDKFIAAQDGASTFAVPGSSPEQDRCIFTGVLMEGLWGIAPSAVSSYFEGKVTSQSLGQYLLAEVPKRAQTYNLRLNPYVQPLFPLGSDVYFGNTIPKPDPPHFSPWPSLGDVLSLGFRSAPHHPLSETFHPGLALQARIKSQDIPTHFETGSGLAVEGLPVQAIWLPPEFFAGTGGRLDWWHLGTQASGSLDRSVPALIELQNGHFLAITGLPQFIVSCVCDGKGAQALVYRELNATVETANLASDAICQMESGSLRADTVSALAAQLREFKHVDPTLGVISAYLYDSIGDVENIRRMAGFYVDNGQAIPYDIVLLAQVETQWSDSHSQLEVSIPYVPYRAPRNEAENQHPWTCSSMDAKHGDVAGLWPWMRQGWTYLDDLLPMELSLNLPSLAELRPHLTSARFSSFSNEGGLELAKIFKMSPWLPT